MNTTFYPLRVKEIRRETEDAVRISFELSEDQKPFFEYKHGQYLTVKAQVNGKEERRAYSLCSSPIWNEPPAIAVKKIEGGVVSHFLNHEVQEGSTLDVMPAQGSFYTPLEEAQRKTYYLFGAGSGITPLMSILKTVVEAEPKSSVLLLYGNRNEQSIIFKEELDNLAKRYEGQLQIEYALSQPARVKNNGWKGFLKKVSTNWDGKIGRIDRKMVRKFLQENPAPSKDAEYFICGPNDMMLSTKDALLKENISSASIHLEFFSSSELPHEKVNVENMDASKVKVHLDGNVIELEVPAGKTILDVLIAQKLDPPYSCTSGSCSTCMAKLLKGNVKMEVCLALDDDEVEEGYILTCQSHPTTPEVELTYEV